MPDETDWRDIFASPGDWVGVSFETPAWVGRLSRNEADGFATASAEPMSLETEEMGPGAWAAWSRDGGWAAFGTRVRAIAQALGGKAELQTFRSNVTGAERHEVRYVGPAMEEL